MLRSDLGVAISLIASPSRLLTILRHARGMSAEAAMHDRRGRGDAGPGRLDRPEAARPRHLRPRGAEGDRDGAARALRARRSFGTTPIPTMRCRSIAGR